MGVALGVWPSNAVPSILPVRPSDTAQHLKAVTMPNRVSPIAHIRQLFEQRLHASDEAVLAELAALPVLPDEHDPAWEDERTWNEFANRFTALADVAAHRQLRAALPLLLERASYGDPGEMMRGLRHRLEAIVNPDWHLLTDVCIQMATSPHPGARLWSIDELGILRDARALPVVLGALDDEADDVRTIACRSLALICQRDAPSRAIARRALQRYLEQHGSSADQRAGQESLTAIERMS